MNRLFPSWHAVAHFLAQQPRGSVLRLEKYQIGPPADAGMTLSLGLPLGQASDWRFCSPQCGGLHVRDFGAYYSAHLDRRNPRARVASETPQLAGGLAFGALLGAAFGKSKEATLVGAMLGGLFGLAATVSAADKAEEKKVRT